MNSPARDHPRSTGRRFNPDRDVEEWHGKYLPYDLVKEFLVALLVVVILVVGSRSSSHLPDEKPVTVKSWSTSNPVDFAQTAITELDGTSGTATYGPPYNSTPGASQSIGPFSPEQWLGVHHPIDTANDYVIGTAQDAPRSAGAGCRHRHLYSASLGPAGDLDRRLREGRGQRHLRPRGH